MRAVLVCRGFCCRYSLTGAKKSAKEDVGDVGDDVINDGPGTWEQGDLPARTKGTHVRIGTSLCVLSHQHMFSHFQPLLVAGQHKSWTLLLPVFGIGLKSMLEHAKDFADI